MKKISSRQALLLVVSTVFSPAVRLYSAFYSRDVNQSAWIAPLIAGAAAACFILVLNGILKSGRSFSSCADFAIGTAGTKVLAAVYFVWGTLLVALHLRYYAQRITSTIYTDISSDPFIIVMVLLCFLPCVSYEVAVAAMIPTAAPIAASVTMFSARYGRNPEFITALVAVSTLFSIITMPVLITVSMTLFFGR